MSFMSHFLLLIGMIGLYSCSQGGGGSVTVAVSGHLALTSGFAGGLVIEARSGPQRFRGTALSGQNITFTLPYGTWEFIVIGWDGPNLLAGPAVCGYAVHKIELASVNIDLTVRPEICSHSIFTRTGFKASNGSGLRPMKVLSCSSLFDNNNQYLNSVSAPETFETDICAENLSLSDEQKKSAQYIKVKVPGHLNFGMTFPDIEGPCIPSNNGFVDIGNLPLKTIPIEFHLSENSDCSQPVIFSYPDGILGTHPDKAVINSMPESYNAIFLFYQYTCAISSNGSFECWIVRN